MAVQTGESVLLEGEGGSLRVSIDPVHVEAGRKYLYCDSYLAEEDETYLGSNSVDTVISGLFEWLVLLNAERPGSISRSSEWRNLVNFWGKAHYRLYGAGNSPLPTIKVLDGMTLQTSGIITLTQEQATTWREQLEELRQLCIRETGEDPFQTSEPAKQLTETKLVKGPPIAFVGEGGSLSIHPGFIYEGKVSFECHFNDGVDRFSGGTYLDHFVSRLFQWLSFPRVAISGQTTWVDLDLLNMERVLHTFYGAKDSPRPTMTIMHREKLETIGTITLTEEQATRWREQLEWLRQWHIKATGRDPFGGA